MANICITSACNASCEFCFSRDAVAGRGNMTMDLFMNILGGLHDNGTAEIRFLGGEPSLHPAFQEMVAAVLKKNMRAVIFTNGLIARPVIDALCGLRQNNLLLVLNASSLIHEESRWVDNQLLLNKLASNIMPGITVDRRALNLPKILNLIESNGLNRAVRLGISHPAPGENNRYLHPKFYREVGMEMMDFIKKAHHQGIHIDFDCGFVPCMFDGLIDGRENFLPKDLGSRCNPLPDILPDGTAIACFPMAHMGSIRFDSRKTVSGCQNEFTRLLTPYQALGIYPRCSDCRLRKNNLCLGGCRAAAMMRLVKPLPTNTGRGSLSGSGADQFRPVRKPSTAEDLKSPASDDGSGKYRAKWIIPYIDQPIHFWERIAGEYGSFVKEVYFPFPNENGIGSGRPVQPQSHLKEFLGFQKLTRSVIVNPIVLPVPSESAIPGIVEQLRTLCDTYDIQGATVGHVRLARALRGEMPRLRLYASVLLDIFTPLQAVMMEGLFDSLVVSSRIVRDKKAIERLRQSAACALRMIVNEACLPGCPFRTQHFYEMGSGAADPRSLCDELLGHKPWLRLTGAWVLPQHMHLYGGLVDEWKLAGRVTLQDPDKYLKVLDAYAHRSPLMPHEIGGGPASVLEPMKIDPQFFETTLNCGKECGNCDVCMNYFEEHKNKTSHHKKERRKHER